MRILSGQRILLVDDDADVADALRCGLEHHGAEVLVACDGSSGIMRAERDRPDIVLVDLVLPRRSGLSVCSHVHGRGIGRPHLVLMTGLRDLRFFKHGIPSGIDLCVAKPVDCDQLANQLATLPSRLHHTPRSHYAASQAARLSAD